MHMHMRRGGGGRPIYPETRKERTRPERKMGLDCNTSLITRADVYAVLLCVTAEVPTNVAR